jgi:transcriptional regulator with PAS, ATPase and Fis domain
LDRAAGSEATVLLLGESGTGKTRLARQIHERSCRTGRPFLDLNCAGLGASLLESELFGYEKGAFTGANARKQGLLELAAGGTVLLDEIGELDLAVQAKLLKVLESRKFRRLGGGAELSVDVRFIGATNRNLRKAISEGRFREDLYYRLNVIEIPVPALRERTNELPELAARLLTELSEKEGRRPPRLTPDAERRLMRHSWPGNIRELRNVLERALLGAGATISGQELRDAMPAVPDPSPAPDRASDGLGSLAEREREHLIRVLADTGFNVRRSAKILGIARSTLYERLRKHELDLNELRRTARQRVRARPDSR